jgi:hypothetical protein
LITAAAISSIFAWDKIIGKPPLLLQTIYHLHETSRTPFL